MKWREENLDLLKNLEFAIVEVWRANPDMTDHTARRAFESGRLYFRAVNRSLPPRPPELTGVDAAAFEAIKRMSDYLVGRGPAPEPKAKTVPSPIPLETLIACLQELGKSVERHTKMGGRQGYLNFVEKYLR